MARRYRRSIFIGIDSCGKKNIERLREESTNDIKYLNSFQSEFVEDEFASLLDRITELDKKKYNTEKYEVSSFTKKELFEFNIFFIGEEISKSLEVWEKAGKVLSQKKFSTAEPIFILKSRKDKIPPEINNLPRVFIITPELETRAKVKEEELEKGMLEFLLLLLYGNIYENRDFYNKAIIGGENKLLSFGVASLSLPLYDVVEFATLFVGIKLLRDLIGNESEEDVEAEFNRAKNWIDVLDDVEIKEELGLPHPKFKYLPKIGIFKKYNDRENDFKKLLSETINIASKFGIRKNEIAKNARRDLENKVRKTIEDRRMEILDLISDKESKINSFIKLRDRLKFLIGKSGLIERARDELKKMHGNWQSYPKQNFPKKIPHHPYWRLIFVFVVIELLPWFIKWVFIPRISSSFCLKFSSIITLTILLYLYFSKIIVQYIIHRLKVNYEKFINGLTAFYHQNFRALVLTYRSILLDKLIEKLKVDLKNISVFVGYLEKKQNELNGTLSEVKEISFGEESNLIKVSKEEVVKLLKGLEILDLTLENVDIDINPWVIDDYDDFFNKFCEKMKFELNKKILEKRRELFEHINKPRNLKDKLLQVLKEGRPLPFYYHKMRTSNIFIYYPEDFEIGDIEEKFKQIKKIKMDIPDKVGILNVSY